MNIQELRIGNYVSMNFDKEGQEYIIPTIVKELSEVNCRVLSKGEVFVTHYDNIKPIPLTEDILLKCGEDNEHLMVDKLGFVIFKNGYPYQFVRDDYKHLHSLQNLYHSLRGEELNVEL